MIGTIVENSLEDKSILDEVKITKTWHDGDWTLHKVEVTRDDALKIGEALSDGPWYVHFWEHGSDDMLVVFKHKDLWIKHSDKSTWGEARAYGTSIGIPEEQLDFLIPE